MKKKHVIMVAVPVVLFLGWLGITANLNAQESGQKRHGVIYNIADDRKVERVGGIYEPEGLDLYMQRKFNALSDQIKALDEKVGRMDERLASIENMLKEVKQAQGTLVSS